MHKVMRWFCGLAVVWATGTPGLAQPEATVRPSSRSPYLAPGTPEVGGVRHMVLIYHGNKGRVAWTKDAILPYVAYLDEKRQPVDWLFDSFLLIEFALDDGTAFHHHGRGERLPTLADWQWIAESWFRPNQGLDGLEQAVAEVAGKLGPADRKVKVVITLPKPFVEDRGFGPPPGEQEKLDFSRPSDRQRALQWYIQQVLNEWREKQYRRLDLAGFYWTDEAFGGSDQDLARWTSEYLHGLGLKHYWIPYYAAQGVRQWREAGFDAMMMQPNFFFPKERLPLGRFQSTAKIARMVGCGIEIEFDGRALTDPEYRDRLIAYLDAGVYYGWNKDALLGYYEGGGALKQLAEDKGAGRDLYRKVYEFVKGTYRSSGRFDVSQHPDDSANLALASRGAKVLGAPPRPEWGKEIGPEQIIDGNTCFYGGMSGFGAFLFRTQ